MRTLSLRKPYAFLKKDLLNESSYKWGFLLQFFSVFVNVAVFFFLARLIGGSSSPHIVPYGGDYFSFVLIGVAFTSYLEVAVNSLSRSVREGQMVGTLEALLATQTSLPVIIFSSSLYSFLFTSLRILLFLLVGILFGMDLAGANYAGALLILVLSILAFSCFGIMSASFIMYFKKGDPFSSLLSSVNWLLGGAYYPVGILPPWLKVFSSVLPITYSLEGMRLALLKGAGFAELAPNILILVLFTAVLMPMSLFMFSFAVRRAKRDGTLIQY